MPGDGALGNGGPPSNGSARENGGRSGAAVVVRAPRPVTARFALELMVLCAFLAVVMLLRSRGLRIDSHAMRFTFVPMFGSLPKILATGVAIQLAVRILTRRSAVEYLRSFVSAASLTTWARVCAAFMITTFAYAWLKVSVPLLNHRLWDFEAWRLDRALHFGIAPNVFVVEVLGGGPWFRWIDQWYALWILSIFAAWSWGTALPDLAQRRNFMFACALLSIAGVWLYLALPMLGPCYAFPDVFAGVRDQLKHAIPTQQVLAANYARILEGRDGSLRQFNPYLGIAAFPSLHVGAHWLFALWSRRHAPRMFYFWSLATALTFVGSLATGWHYALDGYAGMLLAWGAIRLADRFEPVERKAAEPPAAVAGAAPPDAG